MNPGLYVAFLVATALLIIVPGPTVMLVTSTSLRRGATAGLTAVAGSTCAAAVQVLVVVAGLASVVALIGNSFEWIRWAGVAYLVYLGLRAWFASGAGNPAMPTEVATTSLLRHFVEGFVVTLTNPKTLLFLGAFLPQFVDPALPPLPQLIVLAISFLIIAGSLDSVWALLAARMAVVFRSARAKRILDRIAGSILIGAGAALAVARRAE